MASKTVRHTISGAVSVEPDYVVNHPVLGKYLEEVPEGTKSLVPGMFKPGTVEDRKKAEDKKKSEHESRKTPAKDEK